MENGVILIENFSKKCNILRGQNSLLKNGKKEK